MKVIAIILGGIWFLIGIIIMVVEYRHAIPEEHNGQQNDDGEEVNDEQ